MKVAELNRLLVNQAKARERKRHLVSVPAGAVITVPNAEVHGAIFCPVVTEFNTLELVPPEASHFAWAAPELPHRTNDLTRPAVMGNRRGRPQVRLVKTREAGEWLKRTQESLHRAVAAQGHQMYRGVPLELELIVVVPTISSDASGRVKSIEDAMTGIVYADDCQIVRLQVVKLLAADHPKTVPTTLRVRPVSADPELTKRLKQSTKSNAVPEGA